ncbi:rho guanine nucleotide exchange factor, putative, partial [Entamoeba invadens IP1]|uniref:rho guanine nucleotide exchange factor, putative n=1 Tax=Entamoeba invadens IP1 TaxID=370355 RepID=UPI0002C3F2B0
SCALGGMVYGMDELIQPWRYCTFYGECFVNTVQSFCFAFNDMITWTDSLVPILHNDNIIFYFRFVPENVIRKTDNCKFSPTQTNKSSVRVTSKDKHLIFIFPDKETMLKWVDVFNNCFN